jgi:hypothetical protein
MLPSGSDLITAIISQIDSRTMLVLSCGRDVDDREAE